jgi:C4-type Zn-finger protein
MAYQNSKEKYGRLMALAHQYVKKLKCPICHSDKFKVVPVFEYGGTIMPSNILFFCKKCKKYSERFARINTQESRKYARQIRGEGVDFANSKTGYDPDFREVKDYL